MITRESILLAGYKLHKDEFNRYCDEFYQKVLNKECEPTKALNCRIYTYGDTDFHIELELVEEKEHYWEQHIIYAIDKTQTIEDLENRLLKRKNCR